MVGMRLGGIDPSILRELSGVYKPFVKAFKELISNAFDADADRWPSPSRTTSLRSLSKMTASG